MPKANRKRNKSVTVRMSKSEYSAFRNRVNESGLTQQAYLINAVRDATIIPSDQIATLKEISKTFADQERQLRGLATNINQMAHVANGQGFTPAVRELEQISELLINYRKESDDIWQSIRSSINQQRVTAP